jgi:DNA-binding NarL/FixJ family response regulator
LLLPTNQNPVQVNSLITAMPSPFAPELPQRLQEILTMMCEGLSSKEIGDRLHLSPHTVKDYRKSIFERMGVRNVVELVNKVNQLHADQRLAERPDLKAALAQPPEILVVEDTPDLQGWVVCSLMLAGFPTRGVANRSEMLTALAEKAASILVLDLNLGEDEADGLVIAEEMRHRSDMGIIMMTSRGMVDQRIHGLALGADAYLVKPIDIRELQAVITNLHRRLIEGRFIT